MFKIDIIFISVEKMIIYHVIITYFILIKLLNIFIIFMQQCVTKI